MRVLSHYRLGDELGRGSMGVVYRATDTRLGRPVAIKTLSAEAAGDRERVRRFVQEARSASALNHPNIVTIYDIEEIDGATFIAMELVDGEPLDRILARGPLPVTTALDYGAQIAAALEAAHAAGIIHRDIKPANIVVTRAGVVKVLDFGVAKLFEGAIETMTAIQTGPGGTVGTPAYMSPEQAQAQPVDGRSDVFSLGCVLYEMLTGRRPFSGESSLSVISSILRDTPAPMRVARPGVPGGLQPILDRALAKDPAARYATAGALRSDLDGLRHRLTTRDAGWRRPAIVLPVALILIAAAGFGAWQTIQARRQRWVRDVALPQIARMETEEKYVEAMRLARDAARYAPEEIARLHAGWYTPNLTAEPADAHVAIKNYMDVGGEWEPLGRAPLVGIKVPFGYFRLRLTKEGYLPLEVGISAGGRRFPLRLGREGETPSDMVHVSGGPTTVGVANTVSLPPFLLDRHEVTNREFQRFVDAGGYRDRKFWKQAFLLVDGRELGFEEAMARFRDATGRNGPAGWELGRFPDGQQDLPVGGISWFEAAAYAEFAGKSLPTVHHWFRAANMDELSADILRLSNFDGKAPREIGTNSAAGPFGTVDMAGNVAEWCANQVVGRNLRYILGGSWDDPNYRYTEADGQDPWSRSARYGVRLAKNLGPATDSGLPLARIHGDPATVVPAPRNLVEGYRRFYAYDRTPINAKVEHVDDSSPFWRKERVTIDAAYRGQRFGVNVFLPKNTAPPYQTVVVFPSAYALYARSSELLDYSRFDYLMRSGRAAIYPVYQGTYERRGGPITGASALRDRYVEMAKDMFRAVDYLETRPDVDMQRLGYYSLSMGAYFAPIPLSLEPRIKAAVIAAGGLRYNSPPEIQPANFAPDVRVPVIIINGRNDFQAPPAAQARLAELLGTPAEHKRTVLLDGGHVPNDYRALVREALDWFDRYLGPVH